MCFGLLYVSVYFFLSFAQCIDSVGVETLVGKLNCILCTVCNVNDDFNVFKLLDFFIYERVKCLCFD